MRVAFGVFLILHGAGHLTWFIASFAPRLYGDQVKHGPAFGAPAGPFGRTVGVIALGLTVAFVAAAVGVFVDTAWWDGLVVGASLASAIVAVVWWNPVGLVSAMALLADAGILAAVLFR